MYEVSQMDVSYSGQHALCYAQHFAQLQRPLADAVGKGTLSVVRHHQGNHVSRLAGVLNRHDIVVCDPEHGLRLVKEVGRIGEAIFRQFLSGNLSTELRVARKKYFGIHSLSDTNLAQFRVPY